MSAGNDFPPSRGPLEKALGAQANVPRLLPSWTKRLGEYLIALPYFRRSGNPLTPLRLLRQVGPYTIVSPTSLAALHYLAREVERLGVPGDIVECGSMNGGSAAVMAAATVGGKAQRHVWVFDSFQGLPPTTEKDEEATRSLVGTCVGHPSKVLEVMGRVGMPPERLHIVEGWFADTFPTTRIQQVGLLHIDADWYDSVQLWLERFYDLVAAGGFVVINDYGTWKGCRAAVDEFLGQRDVRARLRWVDPGTRYFQKALS